jgi:pimeloyl-[acyl-carrier protein] methyl ester esterase
VVIAHSLGLHVLPSPLLQEATALVLLGCFTAFVPEGRKGRATQAGLKGMRAALGSKGEKTMLEHFFQRAIQPLSLSACPPSPLLKGLSSAGRQRLDDDLVLLETCRTLPRGWPSNARVLVIQGEQDAVVHPSSHQQLLDQLGSQVERVHRGPDWGHALITTEVWELVERWIESL